MFRNTGFRQEDLRHVDGCTTPLQKRSCPRLLPSSMVDNVRWRSTARHRRVRSNGRRSLSAALGKLSPQTLADRSAENFHCVACSSLRRSSPSSNDVRNIADPSAGLGEATLLGGTRVPIPN